MLQIHTYLAASKMHIYKLFTFYILETRDVQLYKIEFIIC